MREIKYRAYIKELGKVYEVIALMTKKFELEGEDFLRVFINKDRGDGEPANYRIDGVDNVLMQYTDLKDKNGKEIYEFDTVKVSANNYTAEFIDTIYFANGSFRFKGYFGNEITHFGNNIEVIGNVYENPDLFDNMK